MSCLSLSVSLCMCLCVCVSLSHSLTHSPTTLFHSLLPSILLSLLFHSLTSLPLSSIPRCAGCSGVQAQVLTNVLWPLGVSSWPHRTGQTILLPKLLVAQQTLVSEVVLLCTTVLVSPLHPSLSPSLPPSLSQQKYCSTPMCFAECQFRATS